MGLVCNCVWFIIHYSKVRPIWGLDAGSCTNFFVAMGLAILGLTTPWAAETGPSFSRHAPDLPADYLARAKVTRSCLSVVCCCLKDSFVWPCPQDFLLKSTSHTADDIEKAGSGMPCTMQQNM